MLAILATTASDLRLPRRPGSRWRAAARRAALAGLVVLLLGLPATLPVKRVVGAPVAPALDLNPNRGPCAARPIARGWGFPPGATVSIYSERAGPPGEKEAARIAEAPVGADGRFQVTLLTINGDCIDLGHRTPDGTVYTFAAVALGPGVPDGGDPIARAAYTVDRSVPANIRCYGETGHCVQGLFRGYWLAHGLDLGDPGITERESLALFGYPISGEFEQRLEDGRTYTVQYFERARMEYHPENAPPYEALLGQFGRQILSGVPGAPTAPTPRTSQPGALYFAATGHNVPPPFSTFWQRNGGLAVFGYPLSEPFTETLEDGKAHMVQYFERARFEWHPAAEGTPYNVQLGQFGRTILAETSGR